MKNSLIVSLVLTISAPAWADLPLTVEDLISDKGKFKLELSGSYSNRNTRQVSSGDYLFIPTGATSFVAVPQVVGESRTNADTVVGTMGLRYGVTKNADIYTRFSYLNQSSRSLDVHGDISKNRESYFSDAWAGVNYELVKEGAKPALLGFAEVALREKHQHNSASLKSAMLGITTYKAIDPVVFSLTTAYQMGKSRKDGTQMYKPGNLWFISPSVGFAVNDRVTLTTGMQWATRQPGAWDGTARSYRATTTDLTLGVGYGLEKGESLNLTLKSNLSGGEGADLRLSWIQTL